MDIVCLFGFPKNKCVDLQTDLQIFSQAEFS